MKKQGLKFNQQYLLISIILLLLYSLTNGQELNPTAKKTSSEKFTTMSTGYYAIGDIDDYVLADQSYKQYTFLVGEGEIPDGAIITNVLYTIELDDNGDETNFFPYDYEIWLSSASHADAFYECVYDNLGDVFANTDQGNDDDTPDDTDIDLVFRSTDAFNGEIARQVMIVRIIDNYGPSIRGEGEALIKNVLLYVYWEAQDPPETPTLTFPDDGSDCLPSEFTLDWTDVANADLYELQVDNNSDFSSPDVGYVTSSESTGHDIPWNTTFYWKVRALNEAGSSSYSPARSFTTGPPPPEAVILDNPPNEADCQFTDLSLYWCGTIGADAYQLMVDDNSDFSSPEYNEDDLASTNKMLSGLSDGTTYFWRVRGKNTCGTHGSWSSTRSFTTAYTPPHLILSDPADFATCQSTSVSFSWSSVGDVESYQLMVDDNGDFGSPHYNEDDLTSTSQIVSGLSIDETYFWRVRGVNTCGHYGSWSSTWVFATSDAAPGGVTPSSPTDAATCQSLSPTITWSTGSGASSYTVQVDNNSDFSSPVLDEDGIVGTMQALSSLSEGTTYYWRVKSVNSCDLESDWSSTMSFTTTISTIGIPVLSGPENDAGCQPLRPTLSWESVTHAVEYIVEVDDNDDFSSPTYTETCDGNSHNCGELDENTTFYWRVSANGDCGVTGAWSDSRSFTTGSSGIDAPILTSPADLSTDQPLSHTLAWSAVSDAATYQVQLDDNDDFSSPLYDEEVSETSLAVTGLESGTVYFWQTRANGTCSTSEWSDMWQFETSSTSPISITGISETVYSLGQNYPNPFMESTTIEFTIPKEGHVKLEFMDLQGKLIDVFTGYYPAGYHSMNIKLSEKVLSGVYLYRMKTEGFIDTRLCVVR